jgi:hypothetical protein
MRCTPSTNCPIIRLFAVSLRMTGIWTGQAWASGKGDLTAAENKFVHCPSLVHPAGLLPEVQGTYKKYCGRARNLGRTPPRLPQRDWYHVFIALRSSVEPLPFDRV